jgi:hypothetical protein
MTARLCLIFKSLPDPQPEGKKLRAVIVLGFCILASAAQKTKSRGCSISSCGPFAKRAQPSILFANADHGAGSGNLSFNSSTLPNQQLAGYSSVATPKLLRYWMRRTSSPWPGLQQHNRFTAPLPPSV